MFAVLNRIFNKRKIVRSKHKHENALALEMDKEEGRSRHESAWKGSDVPVVLLQ